MNIQKKYPMSPSRANTGDPCRSDISDTYALSLRHTGLCTMFLVPWIMTTHFFKTRKV